MMVWKRYDAGDGLILVRIILEFISKDWRNIPWRVDGIIPQEHRVPDAVCGKEIPLDRV